MSPSELGRLLIALGLIVAGAGLLVLLIGRIPGLGRLPGDVNIRREGFVLYFPLATMIVVSLVLTLLVNLIFRR